MTRRLYVLLSFFTARVSPKLWTFRRRGWGYRGFMVDLRYGHVLWLLCWLWFFIVVHVHCYGSFTSVVVVTIMRVVVNELRWIFDGSIVL